MTRVDGLRYVFTGRSYWGQADNKPSVSRCELSRGNKLEVSDERQEVLPPGDPLVRVQWSI
jgi:hypothetical protein